MSDLPIYVIDPPYQDYLKWVEAQQNTTDQKRENKKMENVSKSIKEVMILERELSELKGLCVNITPMLYSDRHQLLDRFRKLALNTTSEKISEKLEKVIDLMNITNSMIVEMERFSRRELKEMSGPLQNLVSRYIDYLKTHLTGTEIRIRSEISCAYSWLLVDLNEWEFTETEEYKKISTKILEVLEGNK